MAHLDHKKAFEELKNRVLEGIQSHFPVDGRTQMLELEGLEVKDDALHADDIRAQHDAKLEGRTWAAPVYGTLALKNKETGKVVDRKRIRMADIPIATRRYSYIVDGQEYQVDNQWQLKPGVYTRRRQTGELETQFNVPNKSSFKVAFDPEKKVFTMERGTSKAIPVYPLLKTLGVDDDTLQKAWGKDLFEANKSARGAATALSRFYKADLGKAPATLAEAEKYLLNTLHASELRPDVTEVTLGRPFHHVEGETFVRATKKMLDVHRGAPEDDRDSLVFKDLRGVGDYAFDKLNNYKSRRVVQGKMMRQINQAKNIRDVVRFDFFNEPIRQTFSKNSLARVADQVNPIEMIAKSMQTTIMGPGGIQSANAITDEPKLVNKSHFGFLDALATPEGTNTGVTLHLPVGVQKRGTEATVPLYNLKTGRMEAVTPKDFMRAKVVLPDQVEWRGDKPVAINKTVKLSSYGNEFKEGKLQDAQYVMRHPSQLFSTTTNLIPFLGNTSGNRASYATHHIEQAVSLLEREAPLVQVSTGGTKAGMRTYEDLLGRNAAHASPIDGRVLDVKKGKVTLVDKSGKKHDVQLYDNFPLNDPKSVLHSEAIVKPGQSVKMGQAIADNNFTRSGQLALGKNLTVAYIPYKGYNYEDGVVISESAAKRLSSMHMHKPSTRLDVKTVTDPRKFIAQHPEAFKKDQYKLLDKDGVVEVGTTLRTGDPLVLGTKPFDLRDRSGAMAIRKSLSGAHTDVSLRWESDHPGEVVGVHRSKTGEVTVHVRTIEPMQVGDKLSNRSGGKGIIAKILPDSQMPRPKDGKPVDVLLNSFGIAGRVNLGQVLETAAAKIAKKTGSPYIVENFGREADMLQKVKKDLKQHGLSDTEELVDPTSGKSLGKALVGSQYMLKLMHQADKKISARSGMDISGAPPETYDRNLMPSGGGKAGGQRMGNLGLYTLLSHGAVANIREMQTWKSEGPDPSPEGKKWASQHHDVWRAIQTGDALPPPKPTFSFQKFTDMLRAAGVNVEKKGNRLQLQPLTNEQVLAMSNGELKKPDVLTYTKLDKDGEPIPMKGGLFDPKVTGGHGGKKWSHFKLAEPMPNPVFEGAIQKVLGLKRGEYADIIEGKQAVDPKTGRMVKIGTANSIAGGPALTHLLGKIDVKKELDKSKRELDALKLPANLAHATNTAKLNVAVGRVKYLRTLNDLGMSAKEAYTLDNVPVLPPAMRPASVLTDSTGKVNIKWADLNGLYSDLGQLNEQMKHPNFRNYLSDHDKREHRAGLYDGLKALMGVGGSYTDRQGKNKGILLQIAGPSPKMGYLQRTLLNRRQDLTMRSVVVPEPAMGLDDVGLPTEKALTLFRPFVVKKMVDIGAAKNPLDARELLGQKGAHKNTRILRALDLAMEERPVLMKRDPALHKHSVQAFNAHRVVGKTVQIHPLVTSGYSMDFDGNCFVGSSKVLLKIPLEEGISELDEATRFIEERFFMKFQPDSMIFLWDGAAVVECRLDAVPHLQDSWRLDKNGATVYDVPPGLFVWSYDHTTGQPSFEPFTHLTVEGKCEVATVRTRGGLEVVASTNESLCVYDHETGTIRDIKPAEAKGRLCPVLRAVASCGNSSYGKKVGWMLGAFASDGFVSGARVVGHTKVSQAHRDAFAEGLSQFVSVPFTRKTYSDYHDATCAVEGESVKDHYTLPAEAVSYFASFVIPGEGRSALRKQLPLLHQFNHETLVGILSGLLDGDGTLGLNHGKVRAKRGSRPKFNAAYSTSSPYLVRGIKELCYRLGIRVGVTELHSKEGRLQKHVNYVLSFSIVDLFRYLDQLLIYTPSAREAIEYVKQHPPTRDHYDLVPIPIKLMPLLTSKVGPCGAARFLRSMQTLRSTRTPYHYCTRTLASEAVDYLEARLSTVEKEACGFVAWQTLVRSTSVTWDIIDAAEPSGRETVYDLCVPRTKVFAVNGGLVVWDTVSVYVPIHDDAVKEAKNMFPSNNLFNEATGRVTHVPTLESALGLYKLSRFGTETNKKFKNPAEALKAVEAGRLGIDHAVRVAGVGKTTAGRLLLSTAVPEAMRKSILTDAKMVLDKKGLDGLYTTLAKHHRSDYGEAANKLKDLGYDASFGVMRVPHPDHRGPNAIAALENAKKNIRFLPVGAHTLSLDDFAPDKVTRDRVVNQTQRRVDMIQRSNLSATAKEQRTVEEWSKATKDMLAAHMKKADKKQDNLYQMHVAGVKPGQAQYQQIKLAPMLLEDASGKIISTPVTRSYAEGLDVAGYWTQMHGARKGSIQKVQEVRDPGYFSKQLMNTTMGLQVNGTDCDTVHGAFLPVTSKEVLDRELARDVTVRGRTFPRGTLVTPDVLTQIRSADKNARIVVRSSLKCQHAEGLCQKCAGRAPNGTHYPLGTNLGILAAQSLGERAVQLTLRSFHGGGIAGSGGHVLGSFDRIKQLTNLPDTIPDEAKLAMRSGTIDKIEHEATGSNIWIGGQKHFVPLDRAGRRLTDVVSGVSNAKWRALKVGQRIQAGENLSDPNRTFVNPRSLYKATGKISSVQNHLVNELHSIYDQEGVRRQHVETVVRAMSNLTRVANPGDAPGILRGEFQPTSVVRAQNRELAKAGKKPIVHQPVLKGIDVLPLEVQEDWLAKLNFQRLRGSIAESAATGAYSNLHGVSPISGMIYGAEFGMTQKHKHIKPHLATVPSWGY